MTHYIPVFTRRRCEQWETVCHIWIDQKDYSTEPTCPECQRYMQQVPQPEPPQDEPEARA